MRHYTHAIVRIPGDDCGDGLTAAGLGPPDVAALRRQHGTYVEALRALGLMVAVLDPLPGFPDAYFVEDAAVFLPDAAVITRPGASSRLGEAEALAPAAAKFRPLEFIRAPGVLDGGDVMATDGGWFIGLSERTDRDGARQLGALLDARGIGWQTVPVGRGLHLKSSVNWIGGNTLLLTRTFADAPQFAGYDKIIVPDHEARAANTLWINDQLLMPAGFPETLARLRSAGFDATELDMSEVAKMDGGLSCLSLRF